MVQASRPLWFFPTPLARGAVGRTQLGLKAGSLCGAGSSELAPAERLLHAVSFFQGKSRAAGVGLLLRGGEKIGDVAVAVGYENSPHFSRAFKKFYGVSPKQYQSSGQDST